MNRVPLRTLAVPPDFCLGKNRLVVRPPRCSTLLEIAAPATTATGGVLERLGRGLPVGPGRRTVGREVDDRTRRPVLDLAPIRPPRIHGPMSPGPDQPRSVHRLANVVVPICFVRQCFDHADVMRKRRRDDHPNRRTELRCRLPRTHRSLVTLVGLLSQSHNGELLRGTGGGARTALLDKAARHHRQGVELGVCEIVHYKTRVGGGAPGGRAPPGASLRDPGRRAARGAREAVIAGGFCNWPRVRSVRGGRPHATLAAWKT